MMDIFANYGSLIKTTLTDNLQYLQYLVKKIPLKPDQRHFLMILNFDLSAEKIKFEFEEITAENRESIAKTYLWVGNTPDVANRYITTDNSKRIFEGKDSKGKNVNPIIQLERKLEEIPLKTSLQSIINIFYPDSMNQYLDVTKIENFDFYLDRLIEKLDYYLKAVNKKEKSTLQKEIKDYAKYLKNEQIDELAGNCANIDDLKNELIAIIEQNINDVLSKKKGVTLSSFHGLLLQLFGRTKDEIKLVTVKVNGNLICEMQDYSDFLYGEKVPEPIITKASKGFSGERICSICGINSNKISAEYLKKAQVKFYNTDKTIFSTHLTKSFNDNYSICNKCFEHLVIGEKFVLNQFRKKWAGKSVMIIPEITPFEYLRPENVEQIQIRASLLNDAIYSFQEGEDLELLIQNLLSIIPDANLVFHYAFFTVAQGGKPNKIFKLIKDVPPTRLQEMIRASKEINLESCIKSKYSVDLKQIYLSIPVRIDTKKKEAKGREIVFDVFDAIFHKLPINLHSLIEKFLYTLRIIMFETSSYNVSIKTPKYKTLTLKDKILMMNTILEFLEKINCLPTQFDNKEVNEIMNKKKKNEKLWPEIEAYWGNKATYNLHEARALFLYGIMLSDVAIAQYEKLKSEAILNKINFDGMNRLKILQLTNEIVEGQRNYKIFGYNQEVFSRATEFFDSVDETNWKLSPAENVFYLMSGYAFKKELLRKWHKDKDSGESGEDINIDDSSSEDENEEEEEEQTED
jgi:CRISPR-associated protein Csh1